MNNEEVLRSFTRLNCATGKKVFSFKCDENYTMEMAVEDYFKVRDYINQPTLDSNVEEDVRLMKVAMTNMGFNFDSTLDNILKTLNDKDKKLNAIEGVVIPIAEDHLISMGEESKRRLAIKIKQMLGK